MSGDGECGWSLCRLELGVWFGFKRQVWTGCAMNWAVGLSDEWYSRLGCKRHLDAGWDDRMGDDREG